MSIETSGMQKVSRKGKNESAIQPYAGSAPEGSFSFDGFLSSLGR